MSTVGLLVFIICCAAAWLILAGLTLRLPGREHFTRPIVWLALASAVWTLSLIKPQALDTRLWLGLSHTADALRLFAWWMLVQSMSDFRLLDKRAGLKGLRVIRLILFAGLLLIVYAGWAPGAGLPMPRADITSGTLIVTSLIPLVAMEQLYRNMDIDQRWAVKFILLGLVISAGMDLVTHFHTLLYRRLNLELWLGRGPVGVVVATLLAVGVRRLLRLPARIALSHQMVFYTGALFALGLALLLVAAGSWYIQQWGGEWSQVAQALFLACALAGLAILLFSGRFRARLQVFLSRHFLPYRYDHRQEWLRLSDTLTRAAGDNDLPLAIIRAMARIMDSPAGLLFVIRNDTLHCVASWNMQPPPQAPRLGREKARIDRQWILNCHADPPEDLPEWLTAMPRAWLAVPLLGDHGPVALVVLGTPLSARSLNWEDYDLLRLAARQAGSMFALQQAGEALGEARQFAALHQSTAFLAHDIKTMVAQLSLLANNADRHRSNPEFIDDMVETVRHSVAKMENILAQLRAPAESSSSDTAPLNLTALTRRVLDQLSHFEPAPVLQAQSDTIQVHGHEGGLETVLNHLVRNAQQACDKGGSVRVTIQSSNDHVKLHVRDTGRGMNQDFVRNKLFMPFHSTKGLSGMGIGAFQSRSLVESMGGSLEVSSREGEGSCFTITLKGVHDL